MNFASLLEQRLRDLALEELGSRFEYEGLGVEVLAFSTSELFGALSRMPGGLCYSSSSCRSVGVGGCPV
jgi:hypothetical protein